MNLLGSYSSMPRKLLLIIISSLTLGSCGQTGPLYLPEKPANTEAPAESKASEFDH